MKNILKIILNDARHINMNVVAIVVVMGLCILPSLYAWFNINSNWDPYNSDATSNLKVAVFSNDEGMTVGNTTVNIGDSIIDALHENEAIGWVFSEDERAAINGVYSGDYYAALVIPQNFTKSIAGILDGDLSGGKIAYYENEKKNAIATKITSKAQTALKTQVNSNVFGTIAEVCLKIADALESVESEGALTSASVKQLDHLSQELGQYITSIKMLEQTADTASSSLETTSDLIQKILTDVKSDFSMVMDSALEFPGLQTASVRIDDYISVLEQGQDNVAETRKLLVKMQKEVNRMRDALADTENSEELEQIVEMLKNSPEEFGTYLSSLVNLETVPVYETENYGSAMSPFYTILAIWVGALILVAIIHTKVHPVAGVENMRPYQMFFGRYTVFFLIGQIQALICVLGDLYFLEIQCQHPFLFWLAGAISSFVFTLLIYSLTFAFGNVGEAIAVVIMVIQVAGAGGTFPIEVLPVVYQKLYEFLPFTYGMNAMRECVSGIYENAYWVNIEKLLLFAVVSLFIGLVLRIPFVRLNEKIEESKERTDLMV